MTSAATIVRILKVVDTRDFEEVGDRMVPVPNSGTPRACDRCGRDHEIHVDVELSDGSTACIGQGCARGDSMEPAIRAAVSSATTRAKPARQHGRALESLRAAEVAWAAVKALPLPEVVLVEEIPDTRGMRGVWAMGDAQCWTLPGAKFDDERRSCLVNGWRSKRYAEHGQDYQPCWHETRVAGLAKRIGKLDHKIAAALAPVGAAA